MIFVIFLIKLTGEFVCGLEDHTYCEKLQATSAKNVHFENLMVVRSLQQIFSKVNMTTHDCLFEWVG